MIEIIFSSKSESICPDTVITCVICNEKSLNGLKLLLPEKESEKCQDIFRKTFFDKKISDICEIKISTTKIIGIKIAYPLIPSDLQRQGEKLSGLMANAMKGMILFCETDFYEDDYLTAVLNLSFGAELGAYYWQKKESDQYPNLEQMTFVVTDAELIRQHYRPYAALANAIRYGRDLLNEDVSCFSIESWVADCQRLEYLGLKIEMLSSPENRHKIVLLVWEGNEKQKSYDTALVGIGQISEESPDGRSSGAVVTALMKALALQKFNGNIVAALVLGEEKRVLFHEILAIEKDIFKKFSPKEVLVLTDLGAEAPCIWGEDKALLQNLTVAGSQCGEKLNEGKNKVFRQSLFLSEKKVYIDCGPVKRKNGEADIFGVKLLNQYLKEKK